LEGAGAPAKQTGPWNMSSSFHVLRRPMHTRSFRCATPYYLMIHFLWTIQTSAHLTQSYRIGLRIGHQEHYIRVLQRKPSLGCVARGLFSSPKMQILTLCKKKILRHIKFAVHAWSNKCWRNKKLIAQFGCTLRDERFEPNQSIFGQLLPNKSETRYCSYSASRNQSAPTWWPTKRGHGLITDNSAHSVTLSCPAGIINSDWPVATTSMLAMRVA